MDVLQLIPGLSDKFVLFVLIFTRISALLTTFVLFKRDLITTRMIVSLSAILSIYVLMDTSKPLEAMDLFSARMFAQELFQVLIGFLAGFILNIVFEVFIGIGQIISTQIGLSMASLIDPRFGYITSLTHFYMVVGTLIFLLLNGHLFAIKLILDSFSVIPLSQETINGNLFFSIVNYASVIFKGSMLLCMTIIVVLMTTNIAIAIMSKFAPQFNLFTIGINLQLIIGLLCIYVTFTLLMNREMTFIQDGINFIQLVFSRMR